MNGLVRLAVPALFGAALLLGSGSARFKDPAGVYGVIDRVVFEPDESNPERIQLWGVFALSKTFTVENGELVEVDFGAMHPAKRGYLYYAIHPDDEATTRAEWAELRSLAGTGAPVAFGGRVPPVREGAPKLDLKDPATLEWLASYNGRVRRASEAADQPDIYPQRLNPQVGLRANPERSQFYYDVLRVPEPISPADGGTAPAGAVRLVARNIADVAMVYLFEIEDPAGAKESSPPITPGAGETTWSPAMRLEAGKRYTWRVRVRPAGSSGLLPVAEASFLARR